MPDFKEISTKLNSTFHEAKTNNDAQTYQRLATYFSQAETYLREQVQLSTKPAMQIIIGKLEANKPLSSEELDLLKLWIVGDAHSYTKMENNFGDWCNELQRIIAEVDTFEQEAFSLEKASSLRAILEDGKRVIYDITFFLEHKERLGRFNEACAHLDKDDRELLSKLLKNKMQSPAF